MDRTIVANNLKKFEGSTSYMYRCSGGEVTVGVGHAILDAAHAQQLNWMGPPAPDLISADYARIAAEEKGMAAAHYEALTQCRLSGDAIDTLLVADIAAFEANLTARLNAWTGYPEPAQQALFDMAYNLGVGGLLKFRKLLAACAAAQWAVAATECRRAGIGDERNRETAALFEQAASA
jgi:GH24 family phage-related lysozyme (muramidase)